MKVNKTQALLYILSTLVKFGYISKEDITQEIEISDLTFRRYIQELRAYLANFDSGRELIYDKKEDKYVLE